MTSGQRIAKLRKERDLQQKEVAEAIDINRIVLNRIELGKRPLRDDEVVALADFFHVTTDYLLKGSLPDTDNQKENTTVSKIKLGDKLKKLREKKGLMQRDVCLALKIEQSTLANYENNRRIPSLDVLIALADYYGTSLDYLAGRTDESTIPFSLLFKQLREQHGLTQYQLGQKLNISPSAIGMYEQGRRLPDIPILIKIASYFGTSLDYLLNNSVTKNNLPVNSPKDLNKFLQQTEIIFNGNIYHLMTEDRDIVIKALDVAFYRIPTTKKNNDTFKK
ncbi:helix-turn-helix domain-containing protein [Megasphaera sp. DISK 18]|uniref:helix-turn-helix domain-containing protein n=1 Tax=Megasphaera sp. DISK 18 TaxID=1776081 RepID=UPI0009F670EF|nr:helix-turn-helix transcriptional regulator [Megasphaera sp. DISK 18]